jgi:hypothetical protein
MMLPSLSSNSATHPRSPIEVFGVHDNAARSHGTFERGLDAVGSEVDPGALPAGDVTRAARKGAGDGVRTSGFGKQGHLVAVDVGSLQLQGEDRFIEGDGAVHVVDGNLEVADRVGHGDSGYRFG